MNASTVEAMLAKLTPEQIIEARALLGPLCPWCGATATRLCDASIAYKESCDSLICTRCAASVHYTGCTLPGPSTGSFDTCPACVERKSSGERCDARTRADHGAFVREHAVAHAQKGQS